LELWVFCGFLVWVVGFLRWIGGEDDEGGGATETRVALSSPSVFFCFFFCSFSISFCALFPVVVAVAAQRGRARDTGRA
jgi:hypothetical protein